MCEITSVIHRDTAQGICGSRSLFPFPVNHRCAPWALRLLTESLLWVCCGAAAGVGYGCQKWQEAMSTPLFIRREAPLSIITSKTRMKDMFLSQVFLVWMACNHGATILSTQQHSIQEVHHA